jgi:hypothetical protein
LYYWAGEMGCFYEKDLGRVLLGEAIKAADAHEGAAGA